VDVSFRLIRKDDVPATNPLELAYRFGLQNTKGEVLPGVRDAEGRFVFDFMLKVKEGDAGPVFLGDFASGPAADRFVYLSWWAVERGDWINRVKVPLGTINWELVKQARAGDQRITADVTGRGPGGGKRPVDWYLS
jgi:hypothetical protein